MVQYLLRYFSVTYFMFEMKMKIHVTLDLPLILLVVFFAQCAIVFADGPMVPNSTVRTRTRPTPVGSEPRPNVTSDTNSSNITVAESSLNEQSNETSRAARNENITLNSYGPHSTIFSIDNGAVKRTFYVVASLTGLVLVYISVKAIRSSRKRKTRRYGLLIDEEMDALDGDDDDEDTTLFDANKHKKKNKK